MTKSLLKKPKVLAHFWNGRECLAYINEHGDKDITGKDVQDLFIETTMSYLKDICHIYGALSRYTRCYIRETDVKGELMFMIDIVRHSETYAIGGYLQRYEKITEFIKDLDKVFQELSKEAKTVIKFHEHVFKIDLGYESNDSVLIEEV